jgi:hypothetical protein
LALEVRGEGRIVDQRADLDVAIVGALGEVGAGDEGAAAVDGEALGVQAGPGWAGLRGAAVAVELWVGLSEGPVSGDKGREAGLERGFGVGGGSCGWGMSTKKIASTPRCMA